MAIAMTARITATMLVVMTLVVLTAADMDGLTVVGGTTRYGSGGTGGIHPDLVGSLCAFLFR